jgi:hypothetical protein
MDSVVSVGVQAVDAGRAVSLRVAKQIEQARRVGEDDGSGAQAGPLF